MRFDLNIALILSTTLFAARPAFAGFDEGLAAYGKNDYASALKEWRPLAESGDAKAQYYLGVMRKNAQGVAQDYALALAWYRKSAGQKYAPAQNGLGSMYDGGLGVARDDKTAARYYRYAAEQGMPEAQFNLAEKYLLGSGVAADPKLAADWFRKAAAQGIAQAQTQLGLMYYDGEGVPQDVNQAAAWFRKAGALGYTDSRVNLEQFGKWFLVTQTVGGKPTNTTVLSVDSTSGARYVELEELDAANGCDLVRLDIGLMFEGAAVSDAIPRSGRVTIELSMDGEKTSYDLPYRIDGAAATRTLSLNGPVFADFHEHMLGVLATAANGITEEADKRERELEKKSAFSFNFTTKDGRNMPLIFPLDGISATDLRRVSVASSCGQPGQ